MPTFKDRLQHAWNAFMNKDPTSKKYYGNSSYYRPDRLVLTRGNERTIITAIYNKIAMDVASINIEHVKLDENKRYLYTIDGDLTDCLSISANTDQTGRAFIQDVVMSMFDEGCVAIVPVDTTLNPINGAYKINSLRTGKIMEWYPDRVKVRVYNEQSGKKEDIILPKSIVAIIENPMYAVMNEYNSVMQRLIRKLAILDAIDEQSGSGKLDLIIQLPYIIKTEARRQQAENRRKEIEEQLASSNYGIAYTDGTEKITQLNRSVENNLMSQIEYLTTMLFSQLGMTPEILNGTADEQTMTNYNNRIIEPVISAIVDEMKRKFLTKTARTQGQSIMFFKDPFKLVPVTSIPDMADKLTRNEIMSSNEVRQVMGMKPVNDPQADQLRNKNINASDGQQFASTQDEEEAPIDVQANSDEYNQNMSTLEGFDNDINELESMLKEV